MLSMFTTLGAPSASPANNNSTLFKPTTLETNTNSSFEPITQEMDENETDMFNKETDEKDAADEYEGEKITEMDYATVKGILRTLKLNLKGKKDELIHRLLEYVRENKIGTKESKRPPSDDQAKAKEINETGTKKSRIESLAFSADSPSTEKVNLRSRTIEKTPGKGKRLIKKESKRSTKKTSKADAMEQLTEQMSTTKATVAPVQKNFATESPPTSKLESIVEAPPPRASDRGRSTETTSQIVVNRNSTQSTTVTDLHSFPSIPETTRTSEISSLLDVEVGDVDPEEPTKGSALGKKESEFRTDCFIETMEPVEGATANNNSTEDERVNSVSETARATVSGASLSTACTTVPITSRLTLPKKTEEDNDIIVLDSNSDEENDENVKHAASATNFPATHFSGHFCNQSGGGIPSGNSSSSNGKAALALQGADFAKKIGDHREEQEQPPNVTELLSSLKAVVDQGVKFSSEQSEILRSILGTERDLPKEKVRCQSQYSKSADDLLNSDVLSPGTIPARNESNRDSMESIYCFDSEKDHRFSMTGTALRPSMGSLPDPSNPSNPLSVTFALPALASKVDAEQHSQGLSRGSPLYTTTALRHSTAGAVGAGARFGASTDTVLNAPTESWYLGDSRKRPSDYSDPDRESKRRTMDLSHRVLQPIMTSTWKGPAPYSPFTAPATVHEKSKPELQVQYYPSPQPHSLPAPLKYVPTFKPNLSTSSFVRPTLGSVFRDRRQRPQSLLLSRRSGDRLPTPAASRRISSGNGDPSLARPPHPPQSATSSNSTTGNTPSLVASKILQTLSELNPELMPEKKHLSSLVNPSASYVPSTALGPFSDAYANSQSRTNTDQRISTGQNWTSDRSGEDRAGTGPFSRPVEARAYEKDNALGHLGNLGRSQPQSGFGSRQQQAPFTSSLNSGMYTDPGFSTSNHSASNALAASASASASIARGKFDGPFGRESDSGNRPPMSSSVLQRVPEVLMSTSKNAGTIEDTKVAAQHSHLPRSLASNHGNTDTVSFSSNSSGSRVKTASDASFSSSRKSASFASRTETEGVQDDEFSFSAPTPIPQMYGDIDDDDDDADDYGAVDDEEEQSALQPSFVFSPPCKAVRRPQMSATDKASASVSASSSASASASASASVSVSQKVSHNVFSSVEKEKSGVTQSDATPERKEKNTGNKPADSETLVRPILSIWEQVKNKWKCEVCLVQNENSVDECVACENKKGTPAEMGGAPVTANPFAKPTPASTSSTSTPFTGFGNNPTSCSTVSGSIGAGGFSFPVATTGSVSGSFPVSSSSTSTVKSTVGEITASGFSFTASKGNATETEKASASTSIVPSSNLTNAVAPATTFSFSALSQTGSSSALGMATTLTPASTPFTTAAATVKASDTSNNIFLSRSGSGSGDAAPLVPASASSTFSSELKPSSSAPTPSASAGTTISFGVTTASSTSPLGPLSVPGTFTAAPFIFGSTAVDPAPTPLGGSGDKTIAGVSSFAPHSAPPFGTVATAPFSTTTMFGPSITSNNSSSNGGSSSSISSSIISSVSSGSSNNNSVNSSSDKNIASTSATAPFMFGAPTTAAATGPFGASSLTPTPLAPLSGDAPVQPFVLGIPASVPTQPTPSALPGVSSVLVPTVSSFQFGSSTTVPAPSSTTSIVASIADPSKVPTPSTFLFGVPPISSAAAPVDPGTPNARSSSIGADSPCSQMDTASGYTSGDTTFMPAPSLQAASSVPPSTTSFGMPGAVLFGQPNPSGSSIAPMSSAFGTPLSATPFGNPGGNIFGTTSASITSASSTTSAFPTTVASNPSPFVFGASTNSAAPFGSTAVTTSGAAPFGSTAVTTSGAAPFGSTAANPFAQGAAGSTFGSFGANQVSNPFNVVTSITPATLPSFGPAPQTASQAPGSTFSMGQPRKKLTAKRPAPKK